MTHLGKAADLLRLIDGDSHSEEDSEDSASDEPLSWTPIPLSALIRPPSSSTVRSTSKPTLKSTTSASKSSKQRVYANTVDWSERIPHSTKVRKFRHVWTTMPLIPRIDVFVPGIEQGIALDISSRYVSLDDLLGDLTLLFRLSGSRVVSLSTDSGRPITSLSQLSSVGQKVVASVQPDQDGVDNVEDDGGSDRDSAHPNRLGMSEAEIDAELDDLLGVPDTAAGKQRSVGKSRDWAGASRDALKKSFQELAEMQGTKETPLKQAIVDTQLLEVRTLCESYAPPLVQVGDAVPLRIAFRLTGQVACELADKDAVAHGPLVPCELAVVVLLPTAYPKAAAKVTAFWTLPPKNDADASHRKVGALSAALKQLCADSANEPVLHELMTSASDWLAALVLEQPPFAEPAHGEMAFAHVAKPRSLSGMFDWEFNMMPSPEDGYLHYETMRRDALATFVNMLVAYVRATDKTVSEEALLGWIGQQPVAKDVLEGMNGARRLLLAGFTAMGRLLAQFEWSASDAAVYVCGQKPKKGVWNASVTGASWATMTKLIVGAQRGSHVLLPSRATECLVAALDDAGQEVDIECAICLCDAPPSESTALSCGHWFCNGCFQSYVSIQVREARVGNLSCPHQDCAEPLGLVSALLLLQNHKGAERLLRFAAAQQIDDDKRTIQCGRAGCGAVMRAADRKAHDSYTKGAFGCCANCGTTRCLRCAGPGHWPASCDVVMWSAVVFARRSLAMEADEEFMSMKWIVGNTKDCPGCARPVEKNNGCNHITCTQCGHEWCYVCTANWTGLHYSCSNSNNNMSSRELQVSMSFSGFRMWNTSRFEHLQRVMAKQMPARIKALGGEVDAPEGRALIEAFEWMASARLTAVHAAELGECLRTFAMPGQKELRQYCDVATKCAESLHDILFDRFSSTMVSGLKGIHDDMHRTNEEQGLIVFRGDSENPSKRAAALSLATRVEHTVTMIRQLQEAGRALNVALRRRLWSSVGAKHLPRLIASARAANGRRGDPRYGLPDKPSEHVVEVTVQRCGDGPARSERLFVSSNWRVFVHDAAASVGIIDDHFVVDPHSVPATIYTQGGGRVDALRLIRHGDVLCVAPAGAPFVPPLPLPEPTPAPEAIPAHEAPKQAPVLTAAEQHVANRWARLMEAQLGDLTDEERAREAQWVEHEPALLLLMHVLGSRVPAPTILTALVNCDGHECDALTLLIAQEGLESDVMQALKDAENELGLKGFQKRHKTAKEAWADVEAERALRQNRRRAEEWMERDAAEQIRAVLPGTPIREAVRAWLQNGRNVEQAIWTLLG